MKLIIHSQIIYNLKMNKRKTPLSKYEIEKLALHKKELRTLLKNISKLKNISVKELKSKTRKQDISDVRSAYFVIARQTTKSTFELIGSIVNRTHAAAYRALKTRDVPEKIKVMKEIRLKLRK